MKNIYILVLTLFIGGSLLAQDKEYDIGGIGLGSRGLNFRSDPDMKYGLLLRTGFGFTGFPFGYFFSPEVAIVKRQHYSERAILYAGVGAASEFRLSDNEFYLGYGLMIPVGLELFPMPENRRLSVSLETGLNFMRKSGNESAIGHYGLIEFTWYLKSERNSETEHRW